MHPAVISSHILKSTELPPHITLNLINSGHHPVLVARGIQLGPLRPICRLGPRHENRFYGLHVLLSAGISPHRISHGSDSLAISVQTQIG